MADMYSDMDWRTIIAEFHPELRLRGDVRFTKRRARCLLYGMQLLELSEHRGTSASQMAIMRFLCAELERRRVCVEHLGDHLSQYVEV